MMNIKSLATSSILALTFSIFAHTAAAQSSSSTSEGSSSSQGSSSSSVPLCTRVAINCTTPEDQPARGLNLGNGTGGIMISALQCRDLGITPNANGIATMTLDEFNNLLSGIHSNNINVIDTKCLVVHELVHACQPRTLDCADEQDGYNAQFSCLTDEYDRLCRPIAPENENTCTVILHGQSRTIASTDFHACRCSNGPENPPPGAPKIGERRAECPGCVDQCVQHSIWTNIPGEDAQSITATCNSYARIYCSGKEGTDGYLM